MRWLDYRAYARVSPDASGFAEELRADLERLDVTFVVPVEPDADGFREKVAAAIGDQPPVEVPVEPDAAGFDAKLAAAIGASRALAGGGIGVPVNIADISADLISQTALLGEMNVAMAAIQRDAADTSADLMIQTGLLGEIRDRLAATAIAASAYSGSMRDAAASTAATGAAFGGFGRFGIGAGLLTFGNIFTVLHVALAAFGAQIAADTAGIAAFSLEASHAIGPAITAASSVANLTTQYAALDPQQKAAALSIKAFTDSLHTADETGIFGVFYQGLNLVESELHRGGPIVTQATNAFGDLIGMLKEDFGSKAWADVFHGASGIVRTDLDALFRLINSGINLIPGLFHNFNFLGTGILNTATALLHGTAAVLEWNPTLTKAVALAGVGYGAYKIFWAGLGAGPGILQRATTGLVGFGTRVATASTYMSEGAGVAASYGLGIGAISGTAIAATAGVALLAAGIGAFVYAESRNIDVTDAHIAALRQLDKATGNNVAGYQAMDKALQGNIASLRGASQQATVSTGNMSRFALTLNRAGISSSEMTLAIRANQQVIGTINKNVSLLGGNLGLTNKQVLAFANATGVDLTQALTISSTQFGIDAAKIQGYAQAVQLSHSPLAQFKVDLQQAFDSSNSLAEQVQSLSAAFQALVTPQLNVVQGQAQMKIDMASAATAIANVSGVIRNHTVAQARAAQAIVTVANDALTQSANIRNMGGSARAAAGPLRSFISWLDSTHASGAAVADILSRIKTAEDNLYSKKINIDIATHYTTTGTSVPQPVSGTVFHGTVHPAGGGVVPGYAPGRDTVPAMLSPGEGIMVPEFVKAVGADRIAAWNRFYSGGRKSSGNLYQGGGIAATAHLGFPMDVFNITVNSMGVLDLRGLDAAGRALPARERRRLLALERAQVALANTTNQNMRQFALNETQALGQFSSLSAIAANAPLSKTGQPLPVTGKFIEASLAKKLSTLRQFMSLIGALKNRGINRFLIGQVIALGPDQGVQYARAILAGGGQLWDVLNRDERQIRREQTLIGQRAAEVAFGTPISKGFAYALKSAEVEAELKKFGAKAAEEFARKLKVALADVPGLLEALSDLPHHHHRRHHHGAGANAVTVEQNFYGSQHPTGAQRAQMHVELASAIGRRL